MKITIPLFSRVLSVTIAMKTTAPEPKKRFRQLREDERACKECGKPFTVQEYDTRFCCSNACLGIHFGKHRKWVEVK